MNFTDIQSLVCNKVSKTDANSQAICLTFIQKRHQLIYDSYDWKAAQIITDFSIPTTLGVSISTQAIAGIHHALAVRLDGSWLDPVPANFAFEASTNITDLYSVAGAGTPLYYEEFMDTTSGTRSVRFFPQFLGDGNSHTLSVLGKVPYNTGWTANVIPNTDNALIAFVTADMWEYLHQVGKAAVKLQEAATLLTNAQQQDTPTHQRPRQSKVRTAHGNSLGEMTDSTADLISDWSPSTRLAIIDRIRRNYSGLWNHQPWPETLILSKLTADNDDSCTLPYLLDHIISVRINIDPTQGGPATQTVTYEDASVYFDIDKDIFERTGEPITFYHLLPLALPAALNNPTQLSFQLTGTETTQVFVKGELNSVEYFETVAVTGAAKTSTIRSYDKAFVIRKPVTVNSLNVYNPINTVLLTLNPWEKERKHLRIKLQPAFTSTFDHTVFVLGKRAITQLMDEKDTCQIAHVQNVLIDISAADLLIKMGKLDVAAALQQRATSGLQSMVDKKIKQATYQPRVIPYAESSDWDNLGSTINQIP